MNKKNYSMYLKFTIAISCIFIIILLLFFRAETIINTNTMTKEFYYEYMSRDINKLSKLLLGVSYFLIFILYSISLVGVLDKIKRCGFKDLVTFLKTKYYYIIALIIVVVMKRLILNMLMEYPIVVYFITPLIVALITLRYISK